MLFSFIVNSISGFDIYKQNYFDDNVSIEINHSDGNSEYFDSVDFPLVNKGDIVYAKVNLPKDRYISNSAICFYVYHSVISIYDKNDEIIYSYGRKQAEEGSMIGGAFVAADIPEESWGEHITIKLEVEENKAYSKLRNFMVMKSIDSYKYLIIDHETELIIFSGIFVVSILSLLVIMINNKWSSVRKQGVFLLSFLCLTSFWFLEYNGIINMFTNNKIFVSNAEYISLFCSPIFFCLFFYEQAVNPKVKRFQQFVVLIFISFIIISTVLNYSTVNYHYCTMISPFHVLLLLGISIDLFIIIKFEKNNKLSRGIIKYGGIISLMIMFIEILRYNIFKNMNNYISVLSKSFTFISFIIFIIALVLSYIVQLADHYIDAYEKRNLEKMAYYDILTGISNRAGCYRYLEKADTSKGNTIVFLDVNNLKHANDVFGHEMGDNLIRFVGEILKSTFENDGFYGRFGGDEFIAVICSDESEKINRYMDIFYEKLLHANKEKMFPFEVSVSYGISISNRENPVSLIEVIKEADKEMYKNKNENKMNRLY